MFSIGLVSVSLRSFPRNPCSRVGANPPRQTTPSASPITRFLTCRRGVVALESALAALILILGLAGVFEIVKTVFVGDLIQRAAHRIAYTNALHDSAAGTTAQLREASLQAVKDEVGDFLSFEWADADGACSSAKNSDSTTADFCLKVYFTVYDNPSDMLNKKSSQSRNAQRGGDAGDLVVVEVVATPQSVLSELRKRLIGDGDLRAVAIRRNERLETL